MSAASSVVPVDVAVVQWNESVGIRNTVEGTGLPPESMPLLAGRSKKGNRL